MEWILANKEWIFSGIGAALIGWFYSNRSNKQTQKSGDNSTNIQIGGNLKIGNDKDDD